MNEKQLLYSVNVEGKKITDVAGGPKKKGAKSAQHKRALEHYAEWLQKELRELRAKMAESNRPEELERLVGTEGVFTKYLMVLKETVDEIGPYRMQTCLYAAGENCKKRHSKSIDAIVCGICSYYEHDRVGS